MITACPECYAPVEVPVRAKEGRCEKCRPIREHSTPKKKENHND